MDVFVAAGTVSTVIFVLSTLPMAWKAYRTKDLSSYSVGNMVLANTGNLAYSVYVFHLPPGPIWFLHSYYLVTTGLMLAMYLRYRDGPPRATGDEVDDSLLMDAILDEVPERLEVAR